MTVGEYRHIVITQNPHDSSAHSGRSRYASSAIHTEPIGLICFVVIQDKFHNIPSLNTRNTCTLQISGAIIKLQWQERDVSFAFLKINMIAISFSDRDKSDSFRMWLPNKVFCFVGAHHRKLPFTAIHCNHNSPHSTINTFPDFPMIAMITIAICKRLNHICKIIEREFARIDLELWNSVKINIAILAKFISKRVVRIIPPENRVTNHFVIKINGQIALRPVFLLVHYLLRDCNKTIVAGAIVLKLNIRETLIELRLILKIDTASIGFHEANDTQDQFIL
nr:MAG TPA: hypothetical protein [Caudoviricetes sp.]